MDSVHLICGVLWTVAILPGYVGPTYPFHPAPSHPKKNPSFLPATHGKTPKCVKDPRLTFCVDPDYYPRERIIYLLENNMFDLDTLLQDETRDTYTFEARDGGVIPSTMSYGKTPPQPAKGYPQPKPSTHYLPPARNNTFYGQRRPSKFGTPQFLKPPGPSAMPRSTNFYSSNTTPSLNSFTSSSYPNKHDSPNYSFHSRPTPHSEGGPYPRYPKHKFRTTAAPYEPPGPQHTWWRKILRREKRQTNNLSDLCPAQASYIMPRAAQSVVGDWMFVVNVDERYTQLVKSETCIQNTCEGSCDVPDGFTAICQQQYVQKRLVALDGSGSKLNSDTFWFPSCCICKVRPNAG